MASRLSEVGIADGLLIFGMLGIFAFTILYGLRSRWWKYIEGVALFFKSLTLAMVSAISVAYLFFGDYPFRQPLRIVVYALFSGSSWFFFIALVRRQRDDGRRRRQLEKEFAAAREAEGLPPVHERRSVTEVFDDWRESRRR